MNQPPETAIRWLRQFAGIVNRIGMPVLVGALLFPLPARSQPASPLATNPSDLLCYMQTADGRVINLSRFCGGRNSNTGVFFSASDLAFLEQYQARLRDRLGQSPQAQTALAQAQQNPQALIQRAKGACASMAGGGSATALASPGQIDGKVINDLALNYYCPDMNN